MNIVFQLHLNVFGPSLFQGHFMLKNHPRFESQHHPARLEVNVFFGSGSGVECG